MYDIDVPTVVRQALDLIGEQLRLDGISVDAAMRDNCSPVVGHPTQLEQVILNLVTNARYAVNENCRNKKIRLQVCEFNDCVTILVEDNGGGIPEVVLPRVFEPFYTTKKMGVGTGLGLSVAYGIVRDMGGKISADNCDGGARFIISLPTESASGRRMANSK